MFTLHRVVTVLNFPYERRFSYHDRETKLNENFKYERLLEQTGVTNVSSCYRVTMQIRYSVNEALIICKHTQHARMQYILSFYKLLDVYVESYQRSKQIDIALDLSNDTNKKTHI